MCFFDTAGNATFPKPGWFALLFVGKKICLYSHIPPSSQILIGELVKRMSIISDSQEDVRNLCQPRDGGRDGAWRPGKVPLQRAGPFASSIEKKCLAICCPRASAASSLYEMSITYCRIFNRCDLCGLFTLKLTVQSQYLHGFLPTQDYRNSYFVCGWTTSVRRIPRFNGFSRGRGSPMTNSCWRSSIKERMILRRPDFGVSLVRSLSTRMVH